MEVYERIRDLRKNYLKLSQTTFGERLGVSRDVIKNIELNVLAKPEQKLSLIKLICKEFSVNEEWILNGTEPMYVEPEFFNLNEFCKQHGATLQEIDAIKAYFELPVDIRRYLLKHFNSQLSSISESEHPRTPDELESQYLVEDEDAGLGAG